MATMYALDDQETMCAHIVAKTNRHGGNDAHKSKCLCGAVSNHKPQSHNRPHIKVCRKCMKVARDLNDVHQQRMARAAEVRAIERAALIVAVTMTVAMQDAG